MRFFIRNIIIEDTVVNNHDSTSSAGINGNVMCVNWLSYLGIVVDKSI